MFIIDGHCDTLSCCLKSGQSLLKNQLQWDRQRALDAGVRIQIMAAYSGEREPAFALREILKQIWLLLRYDQEGEIKLITGLKQFEDVKGLGAVMHLEGANALGHDLDLLHILHRMGLRSIGLTWNYRNQFADGVGEESPAALSNLGKELLREASGLNMIIDVAHLASPGFYEVLELYDGPVVFSHGNFGDVYNHRRNLNGDQLKALALRGGIMGMSLVPDFLSDKPAVSDFIEHICRAAEKVGCDCIALGSDFDGTEWVVGESVSFYRQLPDMLKRSGFTDDETEKILWRNWDRILRQALVG